MLYQITFENAGGNTKTVDIPFDTFSKAENFRDSYNSVSVDSKIIKMKTFDWEMSKRDREIFKNHNFNGTNLDNIKVMYETLQGDKHNVTIPFINRIDISPTEFDNILVFIKDYVRSTSKLYKEVY